MEIERTIAKVMRIEHTVINDGPMASPPPYMGM